MFPLQSFLFYCLASSLKRKVECCQVPSPERKTAKELLVSVQWQYEKKKKTMNLILFTTIYGEAKYMSSAICLGKHTELINE